MLHLKRGDFNKRRRTYLSKYSNPQLIEPEYHRHNNQVALQKKKKQQKRIHGLKTSNQCFLRIQQTKKPELNDGS